jgi:hypothetical protein
MAQFLDHIEDQLPGVFRDVFPLFATRETVLMEMPALRATSSSNHNVTPIIVAARLVLGQTRPTEL